MSVQEEEKDEKESLNERARKQTNEGASAAALCTQAPSPCLGINGQHTCVYTKQSVNG